MTPKAILVPVGRLFSGTAAVSQAAALAHWHDADLHVVHVRTGRARLPRPVEGSTGDSVGRQPLSSMESVDTDGLRLSTASLQGDAVIAITHYAQTIAADLVVVGTPRRRYGLGWRPVLYAKAVARSLACPTLVVPDSATRAATRPFTNILCPTDFSPASEGALRQAMRLAQQSGCTLRLLHVIEGFPYDTIYSGGSARRVMREHRALVDGIQQRMHAAVPQDVFDACRVETSVVTGVPHRAILAAASEFDADLIVMGLPKRRGVARLTTASTATPVLRRATSPVLLEPAPAAEMARVVVTAPQPGMAFSDRTFGATSGSAQL